ncbi:FAD-binding domain-containing protein [Jannaschia pohangensis]|uniref:Deoxyribodipyrimidine photo-lyase n=1 Tax=Jannaschia pohangensis TaxID=390807 RepID=A0A1I3HKK8_9RHOB|nr:FAD-binding domain-containing protein [Jannaschia pohangensis]SFI36201.1 deoxyribodipyrimidine photo-lyase [Jannaschia pohangensis]
MTRQTDLFPADAAPAPTFTPTREAGLDRLRRFVPQAGRAYADMRNHDLPGHPHVSTLSPWLRHRALTEAEVCAAVTERFSPATAEKFLQEVLWRSYFKGWLERRPGVWTEYQQGLKAARNRIATEGGLRSGWEDACAGRTGIEPFDHWAQELAATGYLHNHARMWFASIWMHTLRLPWELGADFFLRHLLDGDPASNTLSWRWVAGLHTRGKTYAARASNIAKYTGDRFDGWTLGHKLRSAGEVEALDGPAHPAPRDMPGDQALPTGGRIGLLLHEDDLHPDYLLARGLEAADCAALIAPTDRSPLAVARHVTDFTFALAQDAVTRQGGTGPVTDDPDQIAAWAEGFDHIVTPYAPTGPLATKLARIDRPMIRPLRDWDAAAWPHTTGGFFKLKTKMADILATVPQDMGA